MRIFEKELLGFVTRILEHVGSEPDEADLVARHLVVANLMGHDSHGVGMLPIYVDHVFDGTAIPNTALGVVREDGPILVCDGGRGFGRRVGGEAMTAACEICAAGGLAVLALRNAHHLGRIGAFGEMAAEAGLVSISFVNVTDHVPLVAPFNGIDARFSTNPLCIGIPRSGDRAPIVLDMATSEIAYGKVLVARNKGLTVPDDTLIDAAGGPTNDPEVMFEDPPGAMLPFGKHKGYALAVMCELLAGALCGGGTIQPENQRADSIINNMLSILIDPARLGDTAWMFPEMDAFIDYVKESPRRHPERPVLVPGEPEAISRQARSSSGIEIDPVTWKNILDAAAKAGVPSQDVQGVYP